jgi:hypothetical protein
MKWQSIAPTPRRAEQISGQTWRWKCCRILSYSLPFDAERGAGTGDVHVKREAVNFEHMNFHGDVG